MLCIIIGPLCWKRAEEENQRAFGKSPSMLVIVASQTETVFQFCGKERREVTEEKDLEQYYCALQETLLLKKKKKKFLL